MAPVSVTHTLLFTLSSKTSPQKSFPVQPKPTQAPSISPDSSKEPPSITGAGIALCPSGSGVLHEWHLFLSHTPRFSPCRQKPHLAFFPMSTKTSPSIYPDRSKAGPSAWCTHLLSLLTQNGSFEPVCIPFFSLFQDDVYDLDRPPR
jgi:hypothetical protein